LQNGSVEHSSDDHNVCYRWSYRTDRLGLLLEHHVRSSGQQGHRKFKHGQILLGLFFALIMILIAISVRPTSPS